MNFVTIGDTKYFRTILMSVEQSALHYPERRFLIYDWGFDPEQLEELNRHDFVEIIGWRTRLINARQVFPTTTGIRSMVKKYLQKHPDYKIPTSQWQREFLLDEKCYCLMDAAFRIKGSFLFLDGDAFIVNRVDEFEASASDIIVTLRSLREIEAARKRGSRHDLNSGVIFFGGDGMKTVALIIEWIKEMNGLNLRRHALSEQTGLSNLILKSDPDAFCVQQKKLQILIGDMQIDCKIVPGDTYNYTAVENGYDPAVNKILHLKSGRSFGPTVDKIRADLAVGE